MSSDEEISCNHTGLEYDENQCDIDDTSSESASLPEQSPFEECNFETTLGCSHNFEISLKDTINHEFRDIYRMALIEYFIPDKQDRNSLILYGCNLPEYNETLYNRILSYVKKILEQIVNKEYTLVIFNQGMRTNLSINWLLSIYEKFDKPYKKNLKQLLVVYPNFFVKATFFIFRTMLSISPKVVPKVTYVKHLEELNEFIDISKLRIPHSIAKFDGEIRDKNKLPPLRVNSFNHNAQFGMELSYIAENNDGDCIALILKDTAEAIRKYHLRHEKIFQNKVDQKLIDDVKNMYNDGLRKDFQKEPDLAAAVLLEYLKSLPSSLIPFSLYNEISQLDFQKDNAKRTLLLTELDHYAYKTLNFVLKLILEINENYEFNGGMTTGKLSGIFGPCLFFCPDLIQLSESQIESANNEKTIKETFKKITEAGSHFIFYLLTYFEILFSD